MSLTPFTSKYMRPRYTLSDWQTSNNDLHSNAERWRESSQGIRNDARKLTTDTDTHTRWTQQETNNKLRKRIDDINEWRNSIDRCMKDVEKEIERLQLEKERAEKALEAKTTPLNIAVKCLMLRENRKGVDLVRDEVEGQLHSEVECIEGCKASLQQKINESYEQLCILEEVRQQCLRDINDKNHALDIDMKCHNLNNYSSNIAFQVYPTRGVVGSSTPDSWNAFSQYNKHRGEAEMKASQRLREAIFQTLKKTDSDLDTQRGVTEYEFEKRIHETETTKKELEYQQRKTKEEIAAMEDDINSLKHAINDKIAPMKVAQSRLENRTNRRNIELCSDIPQYQLCHEVSEIDGSVKALREKLELAESTLRSMQKNLSKIEHDLSVKTNSLSLEKACMNTRGKLSTLELKSLRLSMR